MPFEPINIFNEKYYNLLKDEINSRNIIKDLSHLDITINGIPLSEFKGIDINTDKEINIFISGDVNTLKVENCNNTTIGINGNTNSITSGSGNVVCRNVENNVKTGSGDVDADNIGKNVSTGSGDVRCNNVGNNVKTGSGDIVRIKK